MSVSLVVPDVETALRLFRSASAGDGAAELDQKHIWDEYDDDQDFWSQVSGFEIGNWARTHVQIVDFNSELNGPFLEAYLKINRELLRLYAYAKYGSDDNRNLTQEDLDYFQFKIKITEGSTNGDDNLYELLVKLAGVLAQKMSPRGVVITVLGLALIGGTAWGGSTFLETRKVVRLAEISSEDKKAELEAQKYAKEQDMSLNKEIVKTMQKTNEVSSRALEAAINIQSEILKAASKTGNVVIGDNHLTRDEAKELSANKRGSSRTRIIEQEMKVEGANTGQADHTSVILVDPESKQQYKIDFRDPVISEKSRKKIFAALEARQTIWVKISVREVDGEVRASKLLDVPRRPRSIVADRHRTN